MKKRINKQDRERIAKTLKFVIALLFFIGIGIYTIRQNAVIMNPPGEMGSIQDLDTATEQAERSDDAADDSSDFLSSIPEYSGTPTYVINDNRPEFTDEEYERAEEAYIELSDLDWLGRCGVCEASLGKEMLDSAGERRDISDIHPSGWEQASYPGIIEAEGSYLYHRSHLIAHMFGGADPEIDGPKNLITGTEFYNEKAQLPYAERAVQGWLLKKANGGRILYRVTPVFKGSELVCRGVHIEAADVESKGEKFHINVFCYNVEPGITIDYMTGQSWAK